MANIDFIVGGVAQDDDYYFHKEYINEMWDLLRKNNIILLSPRRTGKTSLMYRLMAKPKYDYKVIHLNVEELKSPDSFYIHLLDALYEFQPEYLNKISKGWDFIRGSIGDNIEEVGAMSFKVKLRKNTDWEKDWEKIAKDLMNKIAKLDDKVLFIIDEFPDMINSMLNQDKDKAISFLHHFRKIRIDKKINNIRWLIGGSVNIRGVLDEEVLINTINDFHSESLPSIKSSEVDAFICEMLQERDVKFNKNILKDIRDLLGEPMPYFLQLFTQELYRYWRREKNNIDEINTKEVKEVFNKSLLGEPAQDKLQHFHSRIRLHYPNQLQEITYLILDSLSQTDNGISKTQLYSQYLNYQQDREGYSQNNFDKIKTKELFKRLMLRLESDFYIYENDNIYNFKTHLIKIWWRKNWAEL